MFEDEYYKLLKDSLENGYPPAAMIKVKKNMAGYGYMSEQYESEGHYVVISGVYQNEEGQKMVKITDPWAGGLNKDPNYQEYSMPIKDFRIMNDAHTGSIIHRKSSTYSGHNNFS